MRRRTVQMLLTVAWVGLAADVAFAGFLLTPFNFSFFGPVLNTLFFLPFTLAGCG